MSLLIACLIVGSFIDTDHTIIPDRFTMGLAVADLAFSVGYPGLHLSAQGLASGEYAVSVRRTTTRDVIADVVRHWSEACVQ